MKAHKFEFDYYFEEIDKTLTLKGVGELSEEWNMYKEPYEPAEWTFNYNVEGPSEYVDWFWAQVDASELFEEAIEAAIYNEICKPYTEDYENN